MTSLLKNIAEKNFVFLRANIPEHSKTMISFWQEYFVEKEIIQINLTSSHTLSPYFPLMDMIRDKFLSLNTDDQTKLLKDIEFYPRHKQIFTDWLLTGIANRDDDLFRSTIEIEWEKQAVFQSFFDLIELLWANKKAPILLLEKFEYASLSLAQFFLWIIQNNKTLPIKIISIFTNDSLLPNHWSTKFRQAFFSQLEKYNVMHHKAINIPLLEKTSELKSKTPNLLNDIILSRCFIAFEDAHGFSNLGSLSETERIEAGYTLSLIFYMQSNIQKALFHLTKTLEIARQTNNDKMIARIHIAIALCEEHSKNVPAIEKHLLIALKTAKEINNQELALDVTFSKFMVHESYTSDPANWKELENVLIKLEKSNKIVQILELKSNIPYYKTCIANEGWDFSYQDALLSLEKAENLQSLYLISKFHHKVAFLCQMKNRNEEAKEHLLKCIDIRKKMGARYELAKVYNGLGHLCFTIGQFSESITYFKHSLELIELRSYYSEICLTLFNIVTIYFYIGFFDGAQDILEKIIKVLDNLNQHALPFHSRRKLYAFLGCTSYLNRQKTLTLDYWSAATQEPEDSHDCPYFSLLASFKADIFDEPSDAFFQNAIDISKKEKNIGFIILLKLIQACKLQSKNLFDEANLCFEEVSNLIHEHSFFEQKPLCEFLRNGGIINEYKPDIDVDGRIKTISINLADAANQEAANIVLLKQLGDISFLKDFQNAITRDMEKEKLFNDAISMIKKNFPFEEIYFIENRLDPKLASFSTALETIPLEWHWNRLFPSYQANETIAFSDPRGTLLAYPFKYNNEHGLWAVLQTPSSEHAITNEEIEIVSLSLRHLDLTLDLHKAKEALKTAATKDTLTGVLSRQEFLNQAEHESNRLARYKFKDGLGFSLIFMDLDNFKFYNDSYGHPAGDFILQGFSNLLRTCVRDLDSIGRFGGDEFILILPSTEIEGAVRVTKRIQEALAKKDGFEKELQIELDYTLAIPQEKKLNCSYGIAYYNPQSPVPLETLIEQADKALYIAKNDGKGVYRIFEHK